MSKRKLSEAEEWIEDIFDATSNMSDEDYCDFLEEIASACESAADAKRNEMESK